MNPQTVKIFDILETMEQDLVILSQNQTKYEKLIEELITGQKFLEVKTKMLERQLLTVDKLNYLPVQKVNSGTRL